MITLLIVTGRDDGCHVEITGDQDLNGQFGEFIRVKLISHDGKHIVEDEEIRTADLLNWINNHHDW